MLSIKQFVEESLVQIAEGIQAAQERVRDKDVQISPAVYSDLGKASEVEFDMAVTVVQGSETDKSTDGRIAIFSALVGGAKTDLSHKEENLTVSRIRFTVQAKIPAAHKGEKRPPEKNPFRSP